MNTTVQAKINYTAIALVVDRSGSMQTVAEDTKGGIQQFIASQKQIEGKTSCTLAQFDHEYQVLYDFSDLIKVDGEAFANQYKPRGSTALLDAIGRTIIEMSNKIETMDPSERPARVIVVIVTDGEENSSIDFTAAKIKELVERKQAQGWDFVFLGADLNAITAATAYGFSTSQSAYYDASNVSGAFTSIETQVSAARRGDSVSFSDAERNNLALKKA